MGKYTSDVKTTYRDGSSTVAKGQMDFGKIMGGLVPALILLMLAMIVGSVAVIIALTIIPLWFIQNYGLKKVNTIKSNVDLNNEEFNSILKDYGIIGTFQEFSKSIKTKTIVLNVVLILLSAGLGWIIASNIRGIDGFFDKLPIILANFFVLSAIFTVIVYFTQKDDNKKINSLYLMLELNEPNTWTLKLNMYAMAIVSFLPFYIHFIGRGGYWSSSYIFGRFGVSIAISVIVFAILFNYRKKILNYNYINFNDTDDNKSDDIVADDKKNRVENNQSFSYSEIIKPFFTISKIIKTLLTIIFTSMIGIMIMLEIDTPGLFNEFFPYGYLDSENTSYVFFVPIAFISQLGIILFFKIILIYRAIRNKKSL